MSRPISGTEPRRRLAAFRTEEAGSSLIQFGILAPVLVVLSFGILDLTLLAFDYHRATEATRRGVRTAVIERASSGVGARNSMQCSNCNAMAAQSSQPADRKSTRLNSSH